MNWKGGRKDPSLEGPPATPFKLPDAARFEEEIRGLRGVPEQAPQQVSEYAPRGGLRDRIEATSRLTLQESAKVGKSAIDEATSMMEKLADRFEEANRNHDRFIQLIEAARKKHLESNERLLADMNYVCDVLDKLKQPYEPEPLANPVSPRNSKPKATVPPPLAPEDDDQERTS